MRSAQAAPGKIRYFAVYAAGGYAPDKARRLFLLLALDPQGRIILG
jgi:hypothetical protein